MATDRPFSTPPTPPSQSKLDPYGCVRCGAIIDITVRTTCYLCLISNSSGWECAYGNRQPLQPAAIPPPPPPWPSIPNAPGSFFATTRRLAGSPDELREDEAAEQAAEQAQRIGQAAEQAQHIDQPGDQGGEGKQQLKDDSTSQDEARQQQRLQAEGEARESAAEARQRRRLQAQAAATSRASAEARRRVLQRVAELEADVAAGGGMQLDADTAPHHARLRALLVFALRVEAEGRVPGAPMALDASTLVWREADVLRGTDLDGQTLYGAGGQTGVFGHV